VTIIVLAWTAWILQKQVNELRRTNELSFQPLLLVDEQPVQIELRLARPHPSGGIEGKSIRSVQYGGGEWNSFESISLEFRRHVFRSNVGRLPARIKRQVVSTLWPTEWIDRYRKSLEHLVSELRSEGVTDTLETDIVLFPNAPPDTANKLLGNVRTIRRSDFEAFVQAGRLELYPYTFLEYQDPYGGEHNVVRVGFVILRIWLQDGIVQFAPEEQAFQERYRWDVGLD
jgi:hypothetical protein